MKSRSAVAVLFAATLCVTTACGSNRDSSENTSAAAAGSTTVSTSIEESAADTSAAGAPESESAVVIDLRIEGGTVTPTNERLDAVVGEPVTIRVDSDTEDELHVHSVPDHSFDVAAANGQSFEFVVDVPGTVAVELHHSGKTVATLLVRP